MAKKTTTFATSKYKGGRRAASTSSGGKVGRGGKFITRKERLRDLRIALAEQEGRKISD